MSTKFLLKFDEAERSLLFQLKVHWKVNNKQTFEETKSGSKKYYQNKTKIY